MSGAHGADTPYNLTYASLLDRPGRGRDGRRAGRGATLVRTAAAAADDRYDGRFVFVRLWYADYPGWSYDWPDTEENLGRLLPQITAIDSHPGSGNILRMDDPELLKYPIAYLSEPGYWFPSEEEALGLRRYLEKGGFLIVDDFHYQNEWAVFERAMRRVLPNGRIERLDITHPVFNSFFEIKSLDVPYPGRLGEMGLKGEFYGIHETRIHPAG